MTVPAWTASVLEVVVVVIASAFVVVVAWDTLAWVHRLAAAAVVVVVAFLSVVAACDSSVELLLPLEQTWSET